MRSRMIFTGIAIASVLSSAAAFAGNSNYFVEGNPGGKRVSDAQSDVNRAITGLRREFEQSPELEQARDALRTATRSYNDARRDALSSLQQNPNYLKISNRIQQLEQKLVWGSFDDHMNDAQRAQAATELCNLRSERSKIEMIATGNDPSVEKMHFAMIDANGKVIALTRAFNDSIRTSPEFVAAKARLDAAITTRP